MQHATDFLRRNDETPLSAALTSKQQTVFDRLSCSKEALFVDEAAFKDVHFYPALR